MFKRPSIFWRDLKSGETSRFLILDMRLKAFRDYLALGPSQGDAVFTIFSHGQDGLSNNGSWKKRLLWLSFGVVEQWCLKYRESAEIYLVFLPLVETPHASPEFACSNACGKKKDSQKVLCPSTKIDRSKLKNGKSSFMFYQPSRGQWW